MLMKRDARATPQSRLEVCVDPTGVLLVVIGGTMTGDDADWLAATTRPILERGAWDLFLETSGVGHYEPNARQKVTEWLLAHRGKAIRSCTVLTGSTLIRMGVAVANLALGGFMRALESRAKFDEALAQARGHRTERTRAAE